MNDYFYTYGSDHWAQGGWTVIRADTREQADLIFAAVHGHDDENFWRYYSSCYEGDEFRRTRMYTNGNLGKYCVEHISIVRTIAEGAKELAANERIGPDV